MKPPPHALFPIGFSQVNGESDVPAGGPQRLFSIALQARTVVAEIGMRDCKECGKSTFLCSCPECGCHTVPANYPDGRAPRQKLDLKQHMDKAMEIAGLSQMPEVKGVQGMISRTRTPEPLAKGVIRAKYDVFVFKDGTVRYDMTDVPVTHFRPKEIGLSVERARSLGNLKDAKGNDLVDGSQVCELRVQDIIPSETCGDYMVKVAMCIDEMMEKLYGLPRFYNPEIKPIHEDKLNAVRREDRFTRDDLIGAMTIGLAPHTSGGILCRIIGYSNTSVGYGHPFFHAAKRRNADGDEDSVILLMDALLNFSRSFLPERRGGLMDAPLVLTTRLDPNEIDKEAHNIDVSWEYPLEFYRATLEYKHPKEIDKLMDQVAGRIGSALQYEGFGYTHDTSDISAGPAESAYKTLDTMIDKMNAQLTLAAKIRAVDAKDVVYRVITKHFVPDMIGNLKSFSSQSLRCTKCGAKYRRIPLLGRCYCGNGLAMTVHEKSVKKYLEITKDISEQFDLDLYTLQRIRIIESSINSIFQSDKVKKCKLSDFM